MPKRAAGGQEAPKSAKKSRKSDTHGLVGARSHDSRVLKKMARKVRRLVATYFFRSLLAGSDFNWSERCKEPLASTRCKGFALFIFPEFGSGTVFHGRLLLNSEAIQSGYTDNVWALLTDTWLYVCKQFITIGRTCLEGRRRINWLPWCVLTDAFF